jgi:uncharacterized protein (DUF488 family)
MLFTLGHSNHSAEKFVWLLKQHAIELVVDVRSQPFSRYSPHFRKQSLGELLAEHGIAYLWLPALGGRPKEPELYDALGRPDYVKMAQTKAFREGVMRLLSEVNQRRTAIVCSEEDPSHCHRRLLVVRALTLENPAWPERILHIRKDGSTQTEAELLQAEANPQPKLF